jgi:L-fuculose-phosphate aldolase
MLYEKQRTEVAEKALGLLTSGLIINTSGNVSLRIGEHVAITPSGRDYRTLNPGDIAVVNLKGDLIEAEFLPSSETPLHLAIYDSNPDVTAIIHTHSVDATAISTVLDRQLPAIHYQMVDLGGAVPIAPYRTFGSAELADVTSKALQGRSAVIMKNHGALTTADTLDKAFSRCITLEWCAKVYLRAMSIGSPSTLSDDQMRLAKQQFNDFKEKRVAFKPT